MDYDILGKELAEYIQFGLSLEVLQEVLSRWDFVQSRTTIRLIHSEWNREFLRSVPHKKFLDLSIVVYIELVRRKEELISFVVDNRMLNIWNISEEMLFCTAFDNLKKEKFIIRDMEKIMQEMSGEEIKPTPYDGINYVLTNKERWFGARGMLRVDLLQEFSDLVGSDLYILPNTVHDLILIPVKTIVTREDLKDMMDIIKEDGELGRDRLSENMYYFSRKAEEIAIYDSWKI